MRARDGFVDLRVGASAPGDDSVWPSFTDIMTVIVMIFLMALVFVMVRNVELGRQLVTSEIERQQSFRKSESLGRQLGALELAMSGLRKSLGESQTEVESLRGENATLSGVNLSLNQRIDSLAAQLARVNELLEVEQRERRALATRFAEQGEQLQAQQQSLETATRGYQQAQLQIETLRERIQQRRIENQALQKLADTSGEKYRSLREEFERLDEQYRDLVRPARSAAGKYIVAVRIDKDDDGYRYRVTEPQREPTDYNQSQLDKRLGALKSERGENLYTRVIIPENNNLSHNEAWRLTQRILRAYDYYYQSYDAAGN